MGSLNSILAVIPNPSAIEFINLGAKMCNVSVLTAENVLTVAPKLAVSGMTLLVASSPARIQLTFSMTGSNWSKFLLSMV